MQQLVTIPAVRKYKVGENRSELSKL